MYRVRTRPKYSAEELNRVYNYVHDATIFPDHEVRLSATVDIIREVAPILVDTAADLSCGNGYLLDRVHAERKYYGDFHPGHEICGPIERTLDFIPDVDVFLLCETLEHLDDPDAMLYRLRAKARKLILSTPNCWYVDDNHEHYWAFDTEAVQQMLVSTGWTVDVCTVTHPPNGMGYQFTVIGAS